MAQPQFLSREELFPKATVLLEEVPVVLDIGPGIRPQPYIKPLVHICCEPFAQYLTHLQEQTKNVHDRNYVFLNMTWQQAVASFPENAVDTIVLSDVIEHLEKAEGEKLLRQSLRIARRQVAIFTTLGFVQQHHADGKDAWGMDGGEWQEHKSGWMPEDFHEKEWQVLACKDFHPKSNVGEQYDKPEGALWAIYTKSPTNLGTWVQALGKLWRDAVNTNSLTAVRILSFLLETTERSKRIIWPIVRMVKANTKHNP